MLCMHGSPCTGPRRETDINNECQICAFHLHKIAEQACIGNMPSGQAGLLLFGDQEFLARIDPVRVSDLVTVGVVNQRVQDAPPIVTTGDPP